jgi:hypothetical protein
MRPIASLLACGALVLAGCGGDAVADRLSFNLDTGGGPVQVDTQCGTFCGGGDQVAVRIDYASERARSDETIEILQYRVDYDLSYDSLRGVPYFAGTMGVALGPGDSTTVVLTVAGTEQRKYVAEIAGGDPASGTATLTFAGYDWDGEVFETESTFDIRFAEIPDGVSTPLDGTEPAEGVSGAAGTGEGGGDAGSP